MSMLCIFSCQQTNFLYLKKWIQDFLGCANPNLTKISRKLHKNKEIWTGDESKISNAAPPLAKQYFGTMYKFEFK